MSDVALLHSIVDYIKRCLAKAHPRTELSTLPFRHASSDRAQLENLPSIPPP